MENATSKNKAPLVSGRTLKNTAESTLRSVKIENSFALRLLSEDGTPLYSGWSIEDVILSILDQMRHRSKSTISIDSDEEEDEKDLEAREESSNSKCSAKSDSTKNSSNANKCRSIFLRRIAKVVTMCLKNEKLLFLRCYLFLFLNNLPLSILLCSLA